MSNNLSNTQMNVLPHEHDMSDIIDLDEALADKQDKLVAWEHIHIDQQTNVISADNTEYEIATQNVAGLVKLWSGTVQTRAANAVSSTANRTYAVQLNSNSQMVVNVPWQDTATWWATSTVAWTVKIFSDTAQSEEANAVSSVANRTYWLQFNSNWQLVVNVPWTDTTYEKATQSTFWLVKLYTNAVQTESAQTITTTVNRTYWVQLNAANQMVVNVPWQDTHTIVDDSLSSTNRDHALSAYQGLVLKWLIDDLQAMSRFLSTWNASTWEPVTFPFNIPYTYKTWDYFMVQVLPSSWYPKKPDWLAYTWAASTVEDTTNEVKVWDFYIFDGAVWVYASNHGQTVTFTSIAWDPYDNTNLANALNAKQDVVLAWNNITIWADWKTINAIDTTYTWWIWITLNWTTINADWLTFLSYWNSTWNEFITAYENHSIVYCRASSNADPSSWSQTRLAFLAYVNNPGSPTSVEFQYYRSIASHSDTQQWDQVYVYKLTSAWVWSNEVREAYTKIAVWTGLSKSYANWTLTISNSQTSAEWWNITGTLSNQTDLQNALDAKLDNADLNVKLFTLTGTSDLTNAQAAFNYYKNWNIPILKYNDQFYFPRKTAQSATLLTFYAVFWASDIEVQTNNGYSIVQRPAIDFTHNGTTVSNIAISVWMDSANSFIAPWAAYTTPFTPTANAHPATKKYVDDKITDTQYSAANWDWKTTVTPSADKIYDKLSAMDTTISWKQASLSNITASEIQTGTATTQRTITAAVIKWSLLRIHQDSPIKPKFIWLWTQAQYEALSSHDGETLYFTTNAS